MHAETVDRIADLSAARQLAEHPISVGDTHVAIPKNAQLIDLVTYSDKPRATEADVTFYDVESLQNYVSRFDAAGEQTETSLLIFAASPEPLTPPSARAVLDYDTARSTSKRRHAASLTLRHTPAFLAWLEIIDTRLTQTEFAELIEEHAHEFVQPESSTLLETIENFSYSSETKFDKKINRRSGLVQLTYSENETTSQVTLPTSMVIRVPVFHGEPAVDIALSLRYRVSHAQLQLQLVAPTLKQVHADLCATIIDDLKSRFGAERVLQGLPPSNK